MDPAPEAIDIELFRRRETKERASFVRDPNFITHDVPCPHAEFGSGCGELHAMLCLAQLFLRYFALGDVARYPARANRFAMLVQLDADITRDPARASVW